ncbi:signal peptidase I [Paractinoplanes rhizophilus]|uniref:Signal peptidase I n=1 Tax=Paractinoplanes rhizophilus TaxID=1416877 RepID=A0ABW2HUQ3_9ACTN
MAAILGMAAIGAWAIMTERISYVATHGTSMNPVYYEGDLVFVVKADSYRVGEIVAYHGDVPGQRILHRIIGGDGAAGFVVKGDNNESIDPLTPTDDEMIGRAVLHVPHGGIWLKPLLGPSGLGMLSFLVISGETRPRTRRDIPRGRRKKRVKAMSSRQGGSWAVAVAVLKAVERLPPVLRVAAAVAAGLTLCALVLGILGWMRPTIDKQAGESIPEQSITFSYTAKVPKSAGYDGTTVTAPEPIFRKLASSAVLRTRYQGPAGMFTLTAALTNGTGWHTNQTWVQKKPFPGPTYDSTITLDFAALAKRADDASRAIGAGPNGSVTIALSAMVESKGLATLSAPLQMAITPFQMSLVEGAKLETKAGGTTPDLLVPREIRIFGVSLITASQARSNAILALIGAVAIAVVVLLAARRRMPTRTRSEIEARYPQLLVPVEPMPSPPGKPVVNVDNFPALVKLAEKYGQMILTWRRPDADDFVVRDEGITYRYRVPLDEPTLQNVELISRPSAGSHRRKASSPSQVS